MDHMIKTFRKFGQTEAALELEAELARLQVRDDTWYSYFVPTGFSEGRVSRIW